METIRPIEDIARSIEERPLLSDEATERVERLGEVTARAARHAVEQEQRRFEVALAFVRGASKAFADDDSR